jgi:hypothetical protein
LVLTFSLLTSVVFSLSFSFSCSFLSSFTSCPSSPIPLYLVCLSQVSDVAHCLHLASQASRRIQTEAKVLCMCSGKGTTFLQHQTHTILWSFALYCWALVFAATASHVAQLMMARLVFVSDISSVWPVLTKLIW